MNVEMKIRIQTDKIDVELTQAEARELFEELKVFFNEPITIPYYPLLPPIEPFYPIRIGDPPYQPWTTDGTQPHITYLCSLSGTSDGNDKDD